MIIFGPVPSRRLGKSLGINNIPPKTCSYSCVYCQIGRTNHMCCNRSEFISSDEICRLAEQKIKELQLRHEHLDYITFVPDGEPTLDINLGHHIEFLKKFGVKIALITNASLLWAKNVRDDIMEADWVSVKIDAADSEIWKKVDRPHGLLKLERIQQGILDFSREYKGTLVTETMLIHGINDRQSCVQNTAGFVKSIHPKKAYLLVPTRPPAETIIEKPTWESIRNAYHIFQSNGVDTECITGLEDSGFYFSDDIIDDLLSITSVHPLREDILSDLLKERNIDTSFIDTLIEKKLISVYTYEGKKFYRRNV